MKTTATGIKQQLISHTSKLKNEMIAKSLLAAAAIVIGVAAIVFLNATYTPFGIGLILMAGVTMYQYSKYYHHAKNIFMHTASNLE